MSTKKIDLGNVFNIVDKGNLFTDKIEFLFHSVNREADDNNDMLVKTALDVIWHFRFQRHTLNIYIHNSPIYSPPHQGTPLASATSIHAARSSLTISAGL